MITPYYTYDPATKRLSRADDPATIDGRKVTHPSAAMYAKIGAYQLADPMPPAPTPPEGKVAVFDGYEESGGKWVQKWRFEDAPPPPPKTYSKYKLVLALQKEGVWERVKAWLQSIEGAYDLYQAAEDISGDEELLTSGIAAAKEAFGWDDAKVAEVLAEAEI